MDEREFEIVNGKALKKGFTTGSCAAAAASAAVKMLLSGEIVSSAEITMPGEKKHSFEITDCVIAETYAECAVIKDAGDDPDITNGIKIFARASKSEITGRKNIKHCKDNGRIILTGGMGVGEVTLPGLQCEVGEPAINPVPRRMIRENAKRTADWEGYDDKIYIEIFVPAGEEKAKKTFNPRLGIQGGISILGTTGIVEPMSEKALVDTIKVTVNKRFAENKDIILISPGNYGKDFCRDELGLDIEKAVEISNFVGEALDYIKYKGFKRILFVGHTGKLVKTAAGVMNTHSSYADCRMETIAAHAASLGASKETVNAILSCVSTDKAFDTVKEEPYYGELKERLLEKALEHLRFRLKNEVEIEVIMFTTARDHLIKSDGAEGYIKALKEEV